MNYTQGQCVQRATCVDLFPDFPTKLVSNREVERWFTWMMVPKTEDNLNIVQTNLCLPAEWQTIKMYSARNYKFSDFGVRQSCI